MTKRRITGMEFDPEHVVVTFMEEPRVTPAGHPVVKATTVQVMRADGGVEALIDTFVEAAEDFLEDLLDATNEGNTRSLDEIEDEQLDDELGLGMGDHRSA